MEDPAPVIPGYEQFVLLGSGMTATVWKAHQGEFDRDVAVKVLKSGLERGEARERFDREKRISAKFGDHPFVVAVHATGTTTDGRPYMVMGLCERGSLADHLATRGSFDVDDVIDIGIKIAGAVQAAHDKGILHRDIKPENILLTRYGPALSDFGISRATTSQTTATVQHLTPVHSAPEAFLDTPPTPQMDVYSLGSTLFTLLAGHPAFPREHNETYAQYILRLERDPLPPFRRHDVPDQLRHIIETAMATQLTDRYPNPCDLEHALRTLQHERDTATRLADNANTTLTRAPTPDPPEAHTVIRAPTPDPPEAQTVIRPHEPRRRSPRSRTHPAVLVGIAGIGMLIGAAVVGGILIFAVIDGGGPTPSTTIAGTTATTKAKPDPSQPARPNDQVIVQVLNGSGVQGAATQRSNDLKAKGYQVLPAGNAPATRTDTAAQCKTGYENEAEALARTLIDLGVPSTVEALTDPLTAGFDAAANCYVLLGK